MWSSLVKFKGTAKIVTCTMYNPGHFKLISELVVLAIIKCTIKYRDENFLSGFVACFIAMK